MTPLPKLSPMDLLQVSTSFDDTEFLYEVKFDGSVRWPTSRMATASSSPGRGTSIGDSPSSASRPSGYLPEGPRRARTALAARALGTTRRSAS